MHTRTCDDVQSSDNYIFAEIYHWGLNGMKKHLGIHPTKLAEYNAIVEALATEKSAEKAQTTSQQTLEEYCVPVWDINDQKSRSVIKMPNLSV